MEAKKIDKDLEWLRQVSRDVDLSVEDIIEDVKVLETYCLEHGVFAMAAVQLGIPKRIVYIKNTNLEKINYGAFYGCYNLENVSFSVPKGCSGCIVGPNGGGKSTLLKILTGEVLVNASNMLTDLTNKGIIEGKEYNMFNEDFESLGLTNKSDYLRGLIMLGLETKKNQERNVSIKEKESLVKLDELSNKINEVKELLRDIDLNDSVYELFEELKKSFDETFLTVIGTENKVNKKN